MPKRVERPREHPRVDREGIVRAAMALADREGLNGVTMRRLGAELGVDPTIVYRHCSCKEAVLDAVADAVLGEVAMPSDVDDWKEALLASSRSLRAALLAHPALLPVVMTRAPRAPEDVDRLECVLGVLTRAGFGAEEAAKAHHALFAFILGYAYLESEVKGDSGGDLPVKDENVRFLHESVPPNRYPQTFAAAPYLYQSLDNTFEFALSVFLDGLAAQLSRRSDRPSPSGRRAARPAR